MKKNERDTVADRTILCWNDRKIVVEHVTLDRDDAHICAGAICDNIGDAVFAELDGHLPVELNQRRKPEPRDVLADASEYEVVPKIEGSEWDGEDRK